MGAAGSKKFLEEAPVEWSEYLEGSWRSERMRELDRLGGLHRTAVPRGSSFSAKLQLLEHSLKLQGDKMQETLTPITPIEKNEVSANTGFQLHTAQRAAKRSGDAEDVPSVPTKTANGKQPSNGRIVLNADTLPAVRKEVLLQRGLLRAPRPAPAAPTPTHVADWRLHMHQARRRLVILVRTMILFRRQTKNKLVKRPARVDGLAFLVPNTLGEDKARFIEELAKYEAFKAEYELTRAVATDGPHQPRADLARARHPTAPVPPPLLPGIRTTRHATSLSGNIERCSSDTLLHEGRTPMPGSPVGAQNSRSNLAGASPERSMLPRIRHTTKGGGLVRSLAPGCGPVFGSKGGGQRHQEEQQLAAMRQSLHLLQMYINRYNTQWSEAQSWGPPSEPYEVSEAWLKSEQHTIYKADVLRKLRNGQVALQIFCGDDYVRLGDGSWQDLWTADPWLLVDGCRPGMMPLTEHIEGVSLGIRVLCQLVKQLTSLAGPEAVAAMTVILHIDDNQQQDVLDGLWAHSFLGLSRSNVLLLVQQRQPGFRYSQVDQIFELDGEDDTEGTHGTLGSGWGMLQMQWAAEALVMDNGGELAPLHGTVFEALAERKVEWLMSRRSRDLSLLANGDGILSLPQLAFALNLKDRAQATIVTEVISSESAGISRSYDSLLMRRSSLQDRSPGSPSASTVVEMRHAELVPIRIAEGKCADNSLTIALQRYLMHVPTVRGVATCPSIFRPKLALNGQLVQVSLDVSDLTANDKCRHVQLRATAHHGMLCSADDVDQLVPLVQNQDKDPDFRNLLKTCSGPGEGEEERCSRADVRVVGGRGVLGLNGRTLLVLVADNTVSLAAARMAGLAARAGQDHIKLVTFAPSDFQVADCETTLARVAKELRKGTLADVLTEVVVRGSWGLVDCIERFAEAGTPDMVIMGSNALTSGASSVMVSSVTLAVVKRLTMPVVVVTANSARHTAAFKSIRSMAVVEAHAKPMLSHLCNKLLDNKRGDRLLLGQVLLSRHQTRQQIFNHRRLMDLFSHFAAGMHHPPSSHMTLDGVFEKAIADGVEDHKICLVGVQLPHAMRSIPPHIIALLRASKAAVLLVKGQAGRTSINSLEMALGPGQQVQQIDAGLS